MKLSRSYKLFSVILVTLTLLFACSRQQSNGESINGGVLTPHSGIESEDKTNIGDSHSEKNDTVLPLVNPGENYNILAMLDGNLDLEQSDEQVLVALPLDKINSSLVLMIASTNPIRNQYDIVWTAPLSTRTLTGITLHSDDLTGNGRSDIIITGFDEKGQHVTDIYAVPRKGEIDDFKRVFSLRVKGNIDIITSDRTPGYYSGLSAGDPYPIIVQKKDPNSENSMDLIETEWDWNSGLFAYKQGTSKSVKGETIQEERIAQVYAGDVSVYEEFLRGAWYRETGNGSFLDMLYFDQDTREILFYNGSIEEVFTWGVSHRTTAKRLYTRVSNAIIPSMYDTVSVSAESYDRIELWRAATNWNGTYRRLSPALQLILDSESSLEPILSPIKLTGVWQSSDGADLIFDMPGIKWTENGKTRMGTASLFSLGNKMVLQIQFMKKNGALEETTNWLADYEEDKDPTRIIRSLSLTPAQLRVDQIRETGAVTRRFEQIEVLTASEQ
ncbi:MAG: hypothetical protein DRP70_14215 [Spirochaetes bacterium]|nr:MAG: hypothetical protein DRP60_06370 [Spirochaetota bacterium]RKX78016.1 MAG: hypothetical protein DRP49_01345 [Spirochaetota bacterium]RKX83818.1 MAG: hypothetical protein DRP70_14215 [Spirochaetota bacterium]